VLNHPNSFRALPVDRVGGTITVPGDKSISHRALMLGAVAEGRTLVHGFLASEDCLATQAAMEALGTLLGGGRKVDPLEIDQIKAFVAGGQRRLRVAQVLAESRERLVKQAGGALFQKRPDLISPGGNAYGEEMTATCLRDIDYYLRLVTYGVVAGDITPIEEIGIIGAREMYRALGTPLEAMAEAVRELKVAAQSLLTGGDAEEAGFYFDYVIGALS